MRYVWLSCVRFYDKSFRSMGVLYLTKTKLKFGEAAFLNKDGYIQKRKTPVCLGRVLKAGKNLTSEEFSRLSLLLQ